VKPVSTSTPRPPSGQAGAALADAERRLSEGIIDCDVHVLPSNGDEIRRYMQRPWRDHFDFASARRAGLYPHPVGGHRADARPKDGGLAGSDPALLREQLIDPFHVVKAVLLQRCQCNTLPNPDFAAEIASAYNRWMADTWLSEYNADGVFVGSIVVAPQDIRLALAEIERWAGDPRFVQVEVDSGARMPYGQRYYWPLYEACQAAGLVFAVHPGTDGIGINLPPVPGYATHYIEWATDFALAYQAHLVSLLTEGVFEQFPDLRVTLVEGGVSWLAPILWRLEGNWRALRHEVPWMRQRPWDYVRRHVRLTSQPLERPDDPRDIREMLRMIHADEVLLFATDYPHWDFDSPLEAFPPLPDALWQRIFRDNAKAWYRL
jgi:predicted TIM-barrel fold metal-dependent hydrolase